jgi:glycosyltransferase involved in cell wall biosynthesis
MRIIVAALQYFPDAPSGSARLAFDEARHLVDLGHEVWMVARDPSGGRPEHETVQGLHVLRYPPETGRASSPVRFRIHQDQTRRLLDRHLPGPADCVHGHTLLQYAGALAHSGRKVRSCFSVHSPAQLESLAAATGAGLGAKLAVYPRAAALHLLERRCLRQTDTITAFSDYTRTLIRRLHGAAMAERVKVIHGWADLDQFRVVDDRAAARKQLGWPSDEPVFFTVRRLVPRMGLDRLIQAVARIASAGRRCRLVIAGEGPLRAALQELADTLGLQACVHLVGRVDEDTLAKMYGAADAFVLSTSELECFGLIAVEALGSGVPVLATPAGAIPEIVGGIEPQWLARDTSAQGIGDLLARFLDGRLPRHSPSALRAYVESRFARTDRVAQLATAAVGAPEARS